MTTWIALLRGINVGGHHIVPMAELRLILAGLGFAQVQTYIQSGNCVFEAGAGDVPDISSKISDAIHARFGFAPSVFVLTRDELAAAIAANPFNEYADPKHIHFSFLAEPALHADMKAMNALRANGEEIALTPGVFYLSAPGGIGRSKLAANVDRHLKVQTTGRNLRTVLKIAEMAE